MIQLLLDANVLGKGFSAAVTRTGIFRASESLIRALLRRDDVDVSCAADESWVSELLLLTYARERNPALEHCVVRAWDHAPGTEVEGLGLITRILEREAAGQDARRDRAALTLLNATARRKTIGPFDVVHSLRTALPDRHAIASGARALTVHDLVPLTHPEWSFDGAEAQLREILASARGERDFLIVNSDATAQEVRQVLGVSSDGVFVTPFAADPQLFHREYDAEVIAQVGASYRIPRQPYLLSLGTIEPRKNLAHLVSCFFQLIEDGELTGVNLVLVGPTGWKTEEIFSVIGAGAELRSRVILTGYVEDGDLAAIYSGASAFVFPSLYEGFGLPVLEAMRCGTPVISSNAGALPEVGGDAAVYVSPEDAPGLSHAFRHVLADPALREELGRRSLAQAAGFTWERTAALTVEAYHHMLSGV